MRGMRLFASEMKRILTDKKVLVAVMAVLFIPVLYSSLFLWAFWDPYERLEELPVAVVNLDQGTVYNDEKIHAGKDLVEKMKEEGEEGFKWDFVDKKTAANGMKDNKYYMTIVIPKEFSDHAVTVLDDEPNPMQLEFIPNGDFNFLSAQIGETAMDKLKEKVSKRVTEMYTEVLFDNLTKISDGMYTASDGAKKLADGSDKALSGALEINEHMRDLVDGSSAISGGLNDAFAGSNELVTGLQTVEEGTRELMNGMKEKSGSLGELQKGGKELDQGTQTLADGLNQLAEGVAPLKKGINQSQKGASALQDGAHRVLDGINEAHSGVNALSDGTGKLQSGTAALAEGTATWQENAAQAQQGASQLSQGLKGLAAKNPELAKDPMFQQLLGASEQLAGGIGELSKGAEKIGVSAQQIAGGMTEVQKNQQKLVEGLGKLAEGQGQVASGIDSLAGGQQKLADGANVLEEKLQEAAAGGNKLADGSAKLADGIDTAAAGWQTVIGHLEQLADGGRQLTEGGKSLNDGLSKLTDGSGKLTDGAQQLEEGSGKLADGLSSVAEGNTELADKLADGARETSETKGKDSLYDMFAEPVRVSKDDQYEVPNYGTGFTPYFLSLGLFVGALLITIVLPIREPAVLPKSPLSWFISKFGMLASVGIIQAFIAATVLLYGLGVEVTSVPKFYLFSILTSLTFMVLIQFLVTCFGDAGRFMAILILILQLISSAGTFPLELVPESLQVLNAWLPMTYSVVGFKAIISSGNMAFMWQSAIALFVFIALSMVGTMVYFTLKLKQLKAEAAEAQ